MKTISIKEYSTIHKSKNAFLIDVRTPEEFQFCNIGGVNIPLNELPNRLLEIPQDKEIYCLCHHGVRSQHACSVLNSLGQLNTTNIMGGIDAWSLEVDPSIARY